MSTINKRLRERLFIAYIARNQNKKEQKRFDFIFGTVFTACIFLFIAAVVIMGAVNTKAGVIMLTAVLACFGGAVGYAHFRKRRIMKRLFPIPVGQEQLEKIYVGNLDILDSLYTESALAIGMEHTPDAEFFNILYNWLNGLNGLKGKTLKMYLFKGKQLNQKFDCGAEDDIRIICISMQDLNINAENSERFHYESSIFGRYLDDIADCAAARPHCVDDAVCERNEKRA